MSIGQIKCLPFLQSCQDLYYRILSLMKNTDLDKLFEQG